MALERSNREQLEALSVEAYVRGDFKSFPPEVLAIIPSSGKEDDAYNSALRIVEDGVIVSATLPNQHIKLDTEIWDEIADRSTLRKLHSYMAIQPCGRGGRRLSHDKQEELRLQLERFFQSWNGTYEYDKDSASMPFHDETTAQRLMVSLYLASELWGGQPPKALVERIQQDRELLKSDSFYAGLNNHGMFQDISLIVDFAVSRLTAAGPSEKDGKAQLATAIQRLEEYVDVAFTAEGVHIEHSPSYHLMVLVQLKKVKDLLNSLGVDVAGSSTLVRLQSILSDGALYATHMVGIDGKFPAYSDTTRNPLAQSEAASLLDSEEFTYAATLGEAGREPSRRSICFEESGYGIYRSAWSNPQATTVLFTAAYNGGYHKHSDENSFIVSANGAPLIIEAGPNGYNYDDPKTKYAFSSFGHNTLLVDGRGLPRHDGKMTSTWMEDLGTTDTILDVKGTTRRFEGVEYTRHLTCSTDSDAEVRVVDEVSSETRHEYRFSWHLGPGIEPEVNGDHISLYFGGEKVGELYFGTTENYELALYPPDNIDTNLNIWFPAMGKSSRAWTIQTIFNCKSLRVETELRTRNFRLSDRTLSFDAGIRWSVSKSQPSVRYKLEHSERPGDLVVAFSGMSTVNDFTYNYRRTLALHDGPKLYVLDDWGDQGSYYYSLNRDTSIFDAVQSSISNVAHSLNRRADQIITVGSSKGGTAALLHGLTLGVRLAVVGAPQTRIGTFTKAAHPNILSYIAGGEDPGDVQWADSVFNRVVQNRRGQTQCIVVVGKGDHHLRGHVIPGAAVASRHQLRWDMVQLEGLPHAEIGRVYSAFLADLVENAKSFDIAASAFRTGPGSLACYVALPPGATLAARLYQDGEVLEERRYSSEKVLQWSGLPRGTYRVRLFIRTGTETTPHTIGRIRL